MWRLNSWEDYEIMGSTRCRRRRDRALETRNYAAFEAHTYERHGTISQTRDRRTRTRLLLAPIWNFTEHHGSRKKLDFCHSSEKLLWSWNFSLPLLLSTMMPCSKTRQSQHKHKPFKKLICAICCVCSCADIERERKMRERNPSLRKPSELSRMRWQQVDFSPIHIAFVGTTEKDLKSHWSEMKYRRLPNTNTHNVMQTHR